MTRSRRDLSRRAFLALASALGAAHPLGQGRASAASRPPLTKAIPGTGERLPVIGMGSWLTFDVGANEMLRAARLEVLRAFFEAGGAVIDSSPMYGAAEEVLGEVLSRLKPRPNLFAATKVWTNGKASGIA